MLKKFSSDCLSFFASCRSLLRRKNAFFFLKKLWTVFIVRTSQSTLVTLFSSRTGCFKGHYHYHPWNDNVLSVSGMCCFGVSLWFNLCHENIHPSTKTPADVWQLRVTWQVVWSADSNNNNNNNNKNNLMRVWVVL